MHELASRLVTNIKIPLMFDSTEWQKMEAGLQHAGGKSLLNSTNYEDGEPRFIKVLELAKQYGASVVVGTIDEQGMARSADGKLQIARRAYEQATQQQGILASDLFFDPLALPISTGIEEDRRNALETIDAIRRIKAQMPLAEKVRRADVVLDGTRDKAQVSKDVRRLIRSFRQLQPHL